MARKSADQRRTEIVEATLTLADEVGPDRLSVEQVAQRVGISQPAVFRHFSSKRLLWDAVGAFVGKRLESTWERALAESPDPVGRLRALVRAQLRLIRTLPAIPALLFSRELQAGDQGLRRTFLGFMRRFHSVLAGVLAEGVQQGQLRTGLDEARAAYVIIALIQGVAMRWSLSGREFDLVQEGEQLLELVMQGLLNCEESS
ncbi:MAG: TetR/AcrR family transcriptional regulator [Thiogranum sp.]|nr:TetR/AcrR family transcriptional regulator [Thiogranum sp.]